jgi:20S proteasome alpha/beta subunit
MTTIAIRDGVMVGDSQATGSYHSRVRKIARTPDGSLIGACGNVDECQAVAAWLVGGCEGKPPAMSNSTVLVLRTDGTIWIAERAYRPYRLCERFAAIGSGSAVAIGAMEAGATALQAVKIAAKHDGGTSGPYHTLKI